VPEGETAATFAITTSPVSANTPITIDTGTANDGYRAPETWLTLRPAGSPPPAPSLASLSLASPAIPGGGSTTGTVTLTAPAPPGGASVWMSGSVEGQVITPPGGVTVPAGSLSATFPIDAPEVNASHWAMIQASYGNGAGMHGVVLRIDPGPATTPAVLALTIEPVSTLAGGSVRGTVGLVRPAPAGGATVFVSSSHPAAQVPPSVNIPAGNSATTFTVTTSAGSTFTSVTISASAGSSTKSAFLTIFEDTSGGPVLSSVTPSVSGATGGTSIPATLFLSAAAPAGGAAVTLSSSNLEAAQVPPIVTVPAGLGFASFTITTSPVTADTQVTITGTYGVSRSATITVLRGGGTTAFLSPSANAADSGGDGNGFESGAANAHGDDALRAVDNNSGSASSTSCTNAARDRHQFFNYGIALPAGTSIRGIEVRLDARVDRTSGSPRMCVQLSWDGGVSWTAAQATATLGTTMTTRLVGGLTNTWGRSWTAGELSNANFRVRVTNVANSTARDFSLDWIAVRVAH
jgi:hypothetical protein